MEDNRVIGKHETGAVSIFVVIFSAILMSIITIGFMGLMLDNQRQAIQTNLSQNAYDAAMTGVEDAKRAIVVCNSLPSTAPESQKIACNTLRGGGEGDCKLLEGVGVSTFSDEGVIIQSQRQGGGTQDLNQAYTCVLVSESAEDYQSPLNRDEPKVIPLRSASQFNTIKLQWKDSSATNTVLPSLSASPRLTPFDEWKDGTNPYPPMMKVQIVDAGQLNNLDGEASKTLFLYPGMLSTDPKKSFALDGRRSGANNPQHVKCEVLTGCTAELSYTADGSYPGDSYMVITPLYRNANMTFSLMNGNSAVKLNGVQAVVDSTGRANDVFRRVSARVDLIPSPVYPNAALSVGGDLCKNFTVTPSSYTSNGSCTP